MFWENLIILMIRKESILTPHTIPGNSYPMWVRDVNVKRKTLKLLKKIINSGQRKTWRNTCGDLSS